jgi:4-hydroxybenzoate polyprenyltransferase
LRETIPTPNESNGLVAWLKLLRLPNVFTALADVAMGYLVTHRNLDPPELFALLAVASCLLYLSGMVLNDVFDANVDAVEQPTRPIPSGRVSIRAATSVGWALWSSGIVIAWFAAFIAGDWRPGIVATLLALCIVLYDRVLKRTPIAPLAMGACRMLNVLLGMSLAYVGMQQPDGLVLVSRPWHLSEWLIAAGVGIYVVGVTIFAGTDALTSARGRLVTGLAVLLGGMSLLACVPVLTNYRPPLVVIEKGWYVLWILLAIITGRRCLAAVMTPNSQHVQAAVRHCVQSIIVLDAAVCVGYASPVWGFAVLGLIIPTVALTSWLRSS